MLLVTRAQSDPVESRTTAVVVVLTVGTILSTAAVLLRVYSRYILLRAFDKDDAVIVGGLVFLLATSVAIGLECHYGLGTHISTVAEEDVVPYLKVGLATISGLDLRSQLQAFYVSTITYSVAIYLVKISIILQYCRIFKDTRFYTVSYAMMIGLSVWTVVMGFLLTFICVPVSLFWEPDTPGTCMNRLALWLSIAVINMATDITCFVMPIPSILRLQMRKNQKIFLAGIFALALCPCAISAYRIQTLSAAAQSSDSTWDNALAAIWTFVELSTGTIAACLPTFRPVMARLMPRVFSFSSPRGYAQNSESARRQYAISRHSTYIHMRGKNSSKHDTASRNLSSADDIECSPWEQDEAPLTKPGQVSNPELLRKGQNVS
ncbi:hypothetical protein JX265_012156 [Neoarthrinium moseri]|uniref:Rhodopsin domain-containing protein n=1 Tax=Neoarthrinium moseri TaxID=1658444 RepID=A0A9P9WAU7_9PEZI|nr:uncharacterized protein JN550_012912 [Neoarthrinium moseri]KAI1843271.1 hypothetical protein JX266_010625 [Neoarthrinium moseri]KAI1855711.1 hypothetical protein JX265_012156 [Neoarthrinium moseri]KAI1858019.1 hypothetical protein JN550_012912 [Neoarthrinium moseri]